MTEKVFSMGRGVGPGAVHCAKCGKPVAGSAKFCGACGTPVPQRACPACGDANGPQAKFCAKCGQPLATQPADPAPARPASVEVAPPAGAAAPRSAPPPQAPPRMAPLPAKEPVVEQPAPTPRVAEEPPLPPVGAPAGPRTRPISDATLPSRKRKPLLIGIGALVFALLAGAGGYAYWTGILGDRPGAVAREVTAGLKQQGFDDVVVAMGKDWVANVSGTVVGQEKRQTLETMLKSRSEIAGINLDGLEVRPSREEILEAITQGLAANRLGHITAEMDDGGSVVLVGRAERESDVARASDVAMSVPGVTAVESRIGQPFSVVERTINQALRESGFAGVRARVRSSDDIAVSGTLRQEEDREVVIAKVVETATAAGETIDAGVVRDEMILEAPLIAAVRPPPRAPAADAPAAAPAFQSVEPVAATPPIVGTWDGRFRGALLPYVAAIEIRSVAGGGLAGESAYFGGGNLVCRGSLRLIGEQGGRYTFEETRTDVRNTCPIRGAVRLTVTDTGTVQGEWSRPDNLDKPSYKGALKKRR